MDPSAISTGVPALDNVIAIIISLGLFKGGMMGVRRFGNGYYEKHEPLTREDLREELKPLIEATRDTSKSMHYLQGFFTGSKEK